MTPPRDIRVLIRTAQGLYLREKFEDARFTFDRSQAAVFNFQGQRVQELLDALEKACGISLEVVPLHPDEICETCDQCGRLALPFKLLFDGNRYLCPECLR